MNDRLAEIMRNNGLGDYVSNECHCQDLMTKLVDLVVKDCIIFFDNNPQVMNFQSPLATPSTMLKIYWGIENES